MENVQITKEKNKLLSQRIAEIVEKYSKNGTVLAIYLTCCKDKNNKNIIEISLIKNLKPYELQNDPESFIKETYGNTEIHIVSNSSDFYKISYMTATERLFAKELVNGTLLYDASDYSELRDSLKKFDIKPWPNAITFEPPLEVKPKQRIKKPQ